MTHAVLEGGQTVFLKSLGWDTRLRIVDGQHGLISQLEGKEILPCRYHFIWLCPERDQVWVEDSEGHTGVFDLIHHRWLVPLRFSMVAPCFGDPYRFKVKEGDRTGILDYLKGVLEWHH